MCVFRVKCGNVKDKYDLNFQAHGINLIKRKHKYNTSLVFETVRLSLSLLAVQSVVRRARTDNEMKQIDVQLATATENTWFSWWNSAFSVW